MSNTDIRSLYFIAIVFDGDLGKGITELKQHFADKYGSIAALKSPPHVTLLMPFKKSVKHEDALHQALQNMANGISPFELKLSGFGHFGQRVIFINVESNETFINLHSDVHSVARSELKIFDKAGKVPRPFHPHCTVAFRDLSRSNFDKAWSEFSDRSFEALTEISFLSLLKHNGKMWQVLNNFKMGGK
ncbi:MAG: 2'-5' RNA ligase family protein [Cyclobacteriaceae bacterium]